jgi:hypothetical protein
MLTLRISPSRDEKSSYVDVQTRAHLVACIDFSIDRMPEQGPSVSGVPFHIGAGIEEAAQERNIPEFDRIVRRPPCHGIHLSHQRLADTRVLLAKAWSARTQRGRMLSRKKPVRRS